jgi:hypothetical protein
MVIDFYENILKFIFELAAIYVRVIFNSFFIFAFLWFIFTQCRLPTAIHCPWLFYAVRKMPYALFFADAKKAPTTGIRPK